MQTLLLRSSITQRNITAQRAGGPFSYLLYSKSEPITVQRWGFVDGEFWLLETPATEYQIKMDRENLISEIITLLQSIPLDSLTKLRMALKEKL